MDDHRQKRLIMRVLEKYARHEELTTSDWKLLEEYKQRSGEHRRIVDLLRDKDWVDEQLRLMSQPSPKEEMWAAIRNEVQFTPKKAKRDLRVPAYVAAASLAAVLAVVGVYRYTQKGDPGKASLPATASLPKAAARDYDSVRRGRGFFDVRMSDGTKLALDGEGSIRYPRVRRPYDTVDVSGKVYCDVTPNKESPLIVRSPGNINVEVLGTAFTLDATKDGPIKVSLFSGRVIVKRGRDSIILKPGKEVLVSANGPLQATDIPGGVRDQPAWTRRARFFDFGERTAFGDAIEKVADYYGYTIEMEGHPEPIPLQGEMEKSRSMDELLTTLNAIEKDHVQVRLEGKRCIISPAATKQSEKN